MLFTSNTSSIAFRYHSGVQEREGHASPVQGDSQAQLLTVAAPGLAGQLSVSVLNSRQHDCPPFIGRKGMWDIGGSIKEHAGFSEKLNIRWAGVGNQCCRDLLEVALGGQTDEGRNWCRKCCLFVL